MTPSTTPGLRIVIAVPVLGRPHRVAPLVENIAAATVVSHRVLFVCSVGDTDEIREVEKSGCDHIVREFPDRGQYAAKVNTAYRESTEEWVFCGADDLEFHAGWDVNAIQTGDRQNAGVVGTQDTFNPLVVKGRQSTHSLVRRSYIEQFGGTYDNTGEIYSETYSHQWVDVEMVETAKARRQWAFCKSSVVKHNHPHWGQGQMDDTYRKATRDTAQDMALYVERMRQFKQAQRSSNRRRAALQ